MDSTGTVESTVGFPRFPPLLQLALQVAFLVLATAMAYRFFSSYRYGVSFDAQARYLHGEIGRDGFSQIMVPRFVVVRSVQLVSVVTVFLTVAFNSSSWVLAVSLALFIGAGSGQRTFLENLSEHRHGSVEFNLMGKVR